ncbi:MAG: methyltransferase domain-containing protein [Planctomycetes bacterium]|nr:methyltransferase domain-containing protein [Planctomycetota bacterium]
MAGNARSISAHYSRAGLTERIDAALRAAGLGEGKLAVADLAALDQFHIGGIQATLALAQRGGIRAGMRVLEVGGGVGGPARVLADSLQATVEVLDLTEEFCRAGAMLTRRAGLEDRVTFCCASALALPYKDAAFDAAWTQHSAMNIADKPRLYAEVLRIVRPGGRLLLHEILAGPGGPVHFPVPWAGEPAISFLAAPQELRRLIASSGFREVAWIDETENGRAWIEKRLAASGAPATASPLGIGLLLGPDNRLLFENLARNLRENRVTIFQGVFERE